MLRIGVPEDPSIQKQGTKSFPPENPSQLNLQKLLVLYSFLTTVRLFSASPLSLLLFTSV